MKQFILIGVLSGLLMATIPLRAQVAPRDSDGRKGSRLELGRTAKTSTTTIANKRFSVVPNPALSNYDHPITVNKNKAINEHYRALLMPSASARTGSSVSTELTAAAPPSELRSATPVQEGSNRMYTSDKLWVSNVYPNPADDVAELDYQFSGSVGEAKLVLLNVLGAPVPGYELNLEPTDRKVRIMTRPLDTGYYLYQLTVDGKKVATKRLLVRHQ
ncbi:T9SS type A sorting domain-containing protein [Spirosoma sp. BT702]|uniref:T9SS type A sorting domain-containing protein n=1 Tax=Spirosoma profusum TaxID=2771354 RepID=A0A926XYL9_9BACT|nr:T9SS type A sorting domain-containing protein [Spirosoma profusum]MBD2703254.1 T9SS type A sorting domain-containing protein [Spirosoma profusum]